MLLFSLLQRHELYRVLCPWDSPGKNTGVGCHALLQGIFPTQGSNLGLLHCRQILYHLSYREDLLDTIRHNSKHWIYWASIRCKICASWSLYAVDYSFGRCASSVLSVLLLPFSYHMGTLPKKAFRGGFPGGSEVKVSAWNAGDLVQPWVGKIPWRRKWQPTPVLLSGESHGGRSLVGYSPWGHKELDMT